MKKGKNYVVFTEKNRKQQGEKITMLPFSPDFKSSLLVIRQIHRLVTYTPSAKYPKKITNSC